jgi:hypothetical protein
MKRRSREFLWPSETFSLLSRAMKLLGAFVVWIVMGTILARGLLAAIHGSFWLLGLGLLGFVILVAKIGCLSHD